MKKTVSCLLIIFVLILSGCFFEKKKEISFYLPPPLLPAQTTLDASGDVEIPVVSGTTVIYTLDGTTPSAVNGTVIKGNTKVYIDEPLEIKAYAYKDGGYQSEIIKAEYKIKNLWKEPVYDDKCATGWLEVYWPGGDGVIPLFRKTEEIVHTGKCAAEIKYNRDAWGARGFSKRSEDWNWHPMYPNQYKYIVFYVYIPESLTECENIKFTMDQGKDISIMDYLCDGKANAVLNKWMKVKIPLEKVSNGKGFTNILYWNTSSYAVHFFIDDVYYVGIGDNEKPAISDIKYSIAVTNDNADFTWKTNEPVKCRFEYWPIADTGNIKSVDCNMSNGRPTDYLLDFKINVSGLTQASNYGYRIIAEDAQKDSGIQGNITKSEGEFYTRPIDTISPVISDISATDIKYNRATIKWNTDEMSYGKISYSQENGTAIESEDENFTTAHSITISQLEAGKKYQVSISASDYFKNSTIIDKAIEFTTDATVIPDVIMNIDGTESKNYSISPYIYGINYYPQAWSGENIKFKWGMGRLGGNRWTAYNWENNASNAGMDWYFHNDHYMGGGDIPGESVKYSANPIQRDNAALLVTVPILGYVAADKDGTDVRNSQDYLNTRFKKIKAEKGSTLSLTPDLTDDYVYEDEFINWSEKTLATRGKVFYSLDNEPDLWNSTHKAIHENGVTYEELKNKTIEYASMIKKQAPNSLVFGPVNYGWYGFTALQGATDSNGREFLPYYLQEMKKYEDSNGKRIVDVLDVHFYTEAWGKDSNGNDVGAGSDSKDSEIVKLRVQAPRSLWDKNYLENSWIVNDVLSWTNDKGIRLIPRIQEQINENYQGTKLAITEYYYGGGDHISGAVAQADVLGIFGREGLYAASLWHCGQTDDRSIYGAFSMFRNYDQKGGEFGEKGLSSITTDTVKTSVYSSIDENGNLVMVVINKMPEWINTKINISNVSNTVFTNGEVFRIEKESFTPSKTEDLTPVNNEVIYAMPPYSVSTIVLKK